MLPIFLSFLLLVVFIGPAASDVVSHKYGEGEEVILYVNKVGPFRNPQETYSYYQIPFCEPEVKEESKYEGLGEALQGYELIRSPMNVKFKKDVISTEVCNKTLTPNEAGLFKKAVKNQYWYQLFLDDLPIWGMVGETIIEGNDEKYYVFTYKRFVVAFNNDRVIEVNLTSENPSLIETGSKITFTYSVKWVPTDTHFDDRFNKYLDDTFFEHQIHWFSIFNSFMMVIFLVGLVSMILMRTLKRDFAKYSRDDDDVEGERELGDESGWKQTHGDVFRAPAHLTFFAALIGTGHQLILQVFSVLFFATIGSFYASRGTMVTALIICYAFTSFVGGYGGGGYYARNGGKKWKKTMLLTAGLFPGISFIVIFILNFIAIGYQSQAEIHVSSLFSVFAIWAFVSLPLTLAGTIVGKNWNGIPDNPCRVNPVPRQIPAKKWYLQPWVNVVAGGILPFGSIFIEMYFIFTSFWHYKYYYVYGFMLLVFVILIIVTVCVTIVSTYFLLNAEDYRWQWISFLSAGSTSAYVFLYSVYYFFTKTKMSGFFQISFYFGYMFLICFGLWILCGTIGFIGTSIFVRRIYINVKID